MIALKFYVECFRSRDRSQLGAWYRINVTERSLMDVRLRGGFFSFRMIHQRNVKALNKEYFLILNDFGMVII